MRYFKNSNSPAIPHSHPTKTSVNLGQVYRPVANRLSVAVAGTEGATVVEQVVAVMQGMAERVTRPVVERGRIKTRP